MSDILPKLVQHLIASGETPTKAVDSAVALINRRTTREDAVIRALLDRAAA
jgi:hypothetical protein